MSVEEETLNSGVNISKLREIKVFKGDTPPELKKGELATDGENLFLCIAKGNIVKFTTTEKFVSKLTAKFQQHEEEYHSQ